MTQITMTMETLKPVAINRRRWGLASAAWGAALWLGAPLMGSWPSGFGSIEHLLCFMPLVGAPLGLLLHARLVEPGSAMRAPRPAQLLQPFAAMAVLASFALAQGPAAAAFAGLWVATGLTFAITGSFRSGLNVAAAQIFMPIAGLWLIVSRLGVQPAGLTDERVLLAALHFQFSGFGLQLVAAATLTRASQRWLRIALAAGLPLIAVGNMAALPPLRTLGVFTVIVAAMVLATVLMVSSRAMVLKLAGLSLFAAMAVALVYAVGKIAGVPLLDPSTMAATHGMLNALGFTTLGLVGHLRERCASAPA
ncbi:MAG: YndJ family transporter [Archangiaceae bacterium]|nr:YndJ family transporter [Archangiaceae bacterium]